MRFFHPAIDCERHNTVYPGDVFRERFMKKKTLAVTVLFPCCLSRGILGRANSFGFF